MSSGGGGVSHDRRELKAEVEFLFDLVDRVREGRLRVPDFQRDYVWTRQDMLDLLDTVLNQYPFGSLFLWQTDGDYLSRDSVGPLRLPARQDGSLTLILDGQQRLTTLAGLLSPDRDRTEEDEDPGRWLIIFDPSEGEAGSFRHVDEIETENPLHVPVFALVDTLAFLDACGSLTRSGRSDAQKLVKRVEGAAKAFQRCKVPLSLFISDDLTAAVEIFTRLNKKGRKVSADEMVSALTSGQRADGFHLARAIDRIIERAQLENFGRIDRAVPLRTTLTLANLDLYRSDWTRLGQRLRDESSNVEAAAIAAETGLLKAIRFLQSEGVPNAQVLPYATQLVALGAFFARHTKPTAPQLDLLRRWLWSTSFTNWFGQGNAARFRRLIEEIRDGMGDPANPVLHHYDLEQPARGLPDRFDFRSARVRAHVAVLLDKQPLNLDGAQIDLARRLLDFGHVAMAHVTTTNVGKELAASPANRIPKLRDVAGLSDDEFRRNMQARFALTEVAGKPDQDRILDSHAVSLEAFDALCRKDFEAFLERRLVDLARAEVEFMKRKGVPPPPEGTGTQTAPVDTDDELPNQPMLF